mmetsp:Transcript_4367/g.10556  ORF Transcript_4367/g.10556 Transcript_4367/m.10556 type:complete len:372 (-) Transcript_4367:273-1388(-)
MPARDRHQTTPQAPQLPTTSLRPALRAELGGIVGEFLPALAAKQSKPTRRRPVLPGCITWGRRGAGPLCFTARFLLRALGGKRCIQRSLLSQLCRVHLLEPRQAPVDHLAEELIEGGPQLFRFAPDGNIIMTTGEFTQRHRILHPIHGSPKQALCVGHGRENLVVARAQKLDQRGLGRPPDVPQPPLRPPLVEEQRRLQQRPHVLRQRESRQHDLRHGARGILHHQSTGPVRRSHARNSHTLVQAILHETNRNSASDAFAIQHKWKIVQLLLSVPVVGCLSIFQQPLLRDIVEHNGHPEPPVLHRQDIGLALGEQPLDDRQVVPDVPGPPVEVDHRACGLRVVQPPHLDLHTVRRSNVHLAERQVPLLRAA